MTGPIIMRILSKDTFLVLRLSRFFEESFQYKRVTCKVESYFVGMLFRIVAAIVVFTCATMLWYRSFLSLSFKRYRQTRPHRKCYRLLQ